MKPISDIESLPAIADRTWWAEILGVSTKTLQRAEQRGLRASRPNARTVLYTRNSIIGYLSAK